jgi:hypothetical protein
MGIVNRFCTNFGKKYVDNIAMEINGRDIVNRIASIGEIKEYVHVLHIPAQTISNWKTRNSFPKVDDLYKIAQYKHVSLEWLVTGNDPDGLSDDDRHLLDDWHELDAKTQAIIRPMITTAAENARKDEVNIAE